MGGDTPRREVDTMKSTIMTTKETIQYLHDQEEIRTNERDQAREDARASDAENERLRKALRAIQSVIELELDRQEVVPPFHRDSVAHVVRSNKIYDIARDALKLQCATPL